MKKFITLASLLLISACAEAQTGSDPSSLSETPVMQEQVQERTQDTEVLKSKTMNSEDTAIFAGGCFWCVEADYEKLPGVIEAISGYTGGHTKNPTYKEVTYKDTGHYEAVKVIYDPSKVSYETLVDYFWIHVDPTDPDGQFCDKGDSYRTAIFARDDQLSAAENSKANVLKVKPFSADIVTPVLPAAKFYKAEKYHQDYYKKNPIRYKYYRNGCGRDKRVEQLWGGQ